jgi:hypothetical protein
MTFEVSINQILEVRECSPIFCFGQESQQKGILELYDVDVVDTGWYTCNISNANGFDAATTYVQVLPLEPEESMGMFVDIFTHFSILPHNFSANAIYISTVVCSAVAVCFFVAILSALVKYAKRRDTPNGYNRPLSKRVVVMQPNSIYQDSKGNITKPVGIALYR